MLGGGIVPGTLMLVGGDPGIGKSTLLIQAAAIWRCMKARCSTSPPRSRRSRFSLRADRLGIATPRLLLLAETDIDAIAETAEQVHAVADRRRLDPDRRVGAAAAPRRAASARCASVRCG